MSFTYLLYNVYTNSEMRNIEWVVSLLVFKIVESLNSLYQNVEDKKSAFAFCDKLRPIRIRAKNV